MDSLKSKQRYYAAFFILGAGILLMRTLILISQGHLEIFVPWAAALLLAEFGFDLSWLIASIGWWKANHKSRARLPMRLAAAAIILHAVRVLIFALGRLGPWIDFDRRPEYRPLDYPEWGWLYFAIIMSVLGLIGVLLVWRLGHHKK